MLEPGVSEPGSSNLTATQYTVFECTECTNTALTIARNSLSIRCHGKPMQPATEVDIDVEPPDIRQILQEVFGLPKASLDICLFVSDQGPLPADEVASSLDYDRSTVTRYMNTLADLGLLQKYQLNRETGGVINVYHAADIDWMRREMLVGFCMWASRAAALIEEANRINRATCERDQGIEQNLSQVFWDASTDG